MDKVKYSTAKIPTHVYCNTCGWPVVEVCCNGDFLDSVKEEDSCWDWWVYCSNKNCKNHEGEGKSQNDIKWISKVNP